MRRALLGIQSEHTLGLHSDLSVLTKSRFSYLGVALAHMAFSQLLWDTPAFLPLALLGRLTNNVFLRYVGRDKRNGSTESNVVKDSLPGEDAGQEEKKSLWPAPAEVKDSKYSRTFGWEQWQAMIEGAARRQRDRTMIYSILLLSICAIGSMTIPLSQLYMK